MEKIIQIVNSLLPTGPMDAIGVGVIDFKNQTFKSLEANTFNEKVEFKETHSLYFDLASVTKTLTNSLSYFLKKDAFDKSLRLCLNHRAGLPAWGLLPKKGWREQILSYPIKESETLYSDFSALRVMLELKTKGIDQKNLCQSIWDKETLYWTDLPSDCEIPQFGFKNTMPNMGAVHDPNAWVINDFCSHAGLYSTIDGLCRTYLNYQAQTDFINLIKNDLTIHSERFSHGWDRVANPKETLAGKGCEHRTFGHLGFTGSSVWIDPDKMKGHIILTNTTKFHWFNKANLNDLRRAIGEVVWEG